MELAAAIECYLRAAGKFGRPLPLSQLGLAREELERTFSAWEEDYHLNRHFELLPPGASPGGDPAVYHINGQAYAAIVMKESIRDVLS